jgi:hypothetical protein
MDPSFAAAACTAEKSWGLAFGRDAGVFRTAPSLAGIFTIGGRERAIALCLGAPSELQARRPLRGSYAK